MSISGPVKIDGFGTRRNAAGNVVVNDENRTKFVRMFATETLSKGDAVCFDLNDTEPTNGYGNHVMIADNDDAILRQAIGICTEAVSTAGDIAIIQVSGVCDFAKVDGTACSPGQLLIAGNTNDSLKGILVPLDTSSGGGSGGEGDAQPVAIHIKDDNADEADSTVFLLNPANL